MYCTPAQLVDSEVRAGQMAQLFGLPPALLLATLAGASRDAWSQDEVVQADAAAVAITAELVRAAGEADARLARRGYILPADPVRFPVLVVWTRAIARYHLHALREGADFDDKNGRIERDYREAREALDLIAAGRLSLGAGDPLATPAERAQAVRFAAPARVFSNATLRDF